MAINNDPVFAKVPKAVSVPVAAANTNMDGTGTIVVLMTANATDGSIVTSLVIWGTVTSTAKRINIWLSLDGGTTWKLFTAGLMAAYTVANTTVQTPVTIVDKTVPDGAIVLPAGAKLGVTSMVNEAIVAVCEYSDLS